MDELTEKEKRILELKNETLLQYTCGPTSDYVWLLPLVALVSFILVAVVLLKGKGTFAAAAIALLLPLPIWMGFLAMIDWLIISAGVIEQAGVEPEWSAVFGSLAAAISGLWYGVVLAAPAFAMTTTVVITRAIRAGQLPKSEAVATIMVNPPSPTAG